MPGAIIRIAQIKVCGKKGDLEANSARLMQVLASIEPHRPDAVVTPECFLDGYVAVEKTVTSESIAQYAIDPATSPHAKAAAAWAARNRCWFIFGCSRRAPEGTYNSALIFDRAGKLIGAYDKVHCQTHDKKFHAGQSLPAWPSDFGPFGVMICADRRWPETVRTLALRGARVLFNPTCGMHDELNLRMMATRSFESEVFIAFTHPAQALVTGPKGEIVSNEVAEQAAFAVTEIDLIQVDEVRSAASSHLRDRRPDVYIG